MRPAPEILLGGAAMTLAMKLAPLLADTPYAVGDAGTTAAALTLLAMDIDRRPETLANDNAAMRALFNAMAAHPLPAALASRVAEAAGLEDGGIRASVLDVVNCKLATVLIDLHAHVEEVDADWARATESQILQILKVRADARYLDLPEM